VHFNDNRCGCVAELRSVIVKARRLADDHAGRERAAAVVKTWLPAQMEKRRAATAAADIRETPSARIIGFDVAEERADRSPWRFEVTSSI
jgi:hypothetical protein